MRLLSVEVRRLMARRAVLVLLAACVVVPALVFAGVAWDTRPVSAAERAFAEEQVRQERESEGFQQEVARCAEWPEEYGVSGADPAAACEEMMSPRVEWYLGRPDLVLAEERIESGVGVLTFVAAFLMLIGTTFVGADWGSGSMSNQLLFEPRRVRVWLAKAGAVVLVSVAAYAAALAAYWGGLAGLANARDIGTAERVVDDIVNSVVWGCGLAAAAALGCYALTMLFRSTVATLGLLFALAVGASILVSLLPIEGNQRFLLHHNALAIVLDGWTYYDSSVCDGPAGMVQDCTGEVRLSRAAAVGHLVPPLVLALVVSIWSFRRRDVP